LRPPLALLVDHKGCSSIARFQKPLGHAAQGRSLGGIADSVENPFELLAKQFLERFSVDKTINWGCRQQGNIVKPLEDALSARCKWPSSATLGRNDI